MAVDVMAMVKQIEAKAKNDPEFMTKLQSDPEKAIESVIGMDIPDGMVDKVMAAVKGQMTLDKVAGVLGMLKK